MFAVVFSMQHHYAVIKNQVRPDLVAHTMPVILGTWETEMEKTEVPPFTPAQAKVRKIPS
jgi:hypothetical protein